MSASLDARNFTQPSVFAENAQTIIPVSPNPGIAYRDPNVNPAIYSQGQPFDTIVDSRIWNQLLYALSAFARESELFSFARWSPMTNYVPGASVTGTDGNLYRAVRASGPALGVGPRIPADFPDYWITLKDWLSSSQGPVGGVVPVGMVEFLPHRFNALPFGWYFCNGERYNDDVPAGPALKGLPQSLKNDWGITTNSAGTNVPLLLDSGGKGYFIRGVDGVTRQPGSVQAYAARAVTASASSSASSSATGGGKITASGKINQVSGAGLTGSGAFTASHVTNYPIDAGPSARSIYNVDMKIDAPIPTPTISTSVSTPVTVNQSNVDIENRPVNIGMTPAIYLGV